MKGVQPSGYGRAVGRRRPQDSPGRCRLTPRRTGLAALQTRCIRTPAAPVLSINATPPGDRSAPAGPPGAPNHHRPPADPSLYGAAGRERAAPVGPVLPLQADYSSRGCCNHGESGASSPVCTLVSPRRPTGGRAGVREVRSRWRISLPGLTASAGVSAVFASEWLAGQPQLARAHPDPRLPNIRVIQTVTPGWHYRVVTIYGLQILKTRASMQFIQGGI